MTAAFKSTLRLGLVNLAILALLLLVAEAFLWLFMPIGERGLDKTFQQAIAGLRPVIRYTEIAPSIRARSARVPQKRPDTTRILCIGASTTQQTTQQIEDSWCGALEERLQALLGGTGKKVETLSTGRGGQRVVDTAMHLQDVVRTWKPDIVITLLGLNDLALNGGPGYVPRRVETSANKRRWTCATYLQLCRLVAEARAALQLKANLNQGAVVEWHSAGLRNLQSQYKALPFQEAPIRNPDPIDEFRSNIAWMLGYLQKSGIATLVLGQPVLWKAGMTAAETEALWFAVATPAGRVRTSGSWLNREMQRYNTVQAEAAARHGAAYLDLDARLPKTLDTYFDDCHFTDKGSAAVAELVAPAAKRVLDRLPGHR